ncbi:putative B3 domain-containing protein [Spatholobus suberectus]|nr:putative B3 domain-containing protein [Spatholobus suberectus]
MPSTCLPSVQFFMHKSSEVWATNTILVLGMTALESTKNWNQHKRNRSQIPRKAVEAFSEDEITALQILEIMKQEKDPHKWHENLLANRRCKQSQEFAEWPPSPIPAMDEDDKDAETLVCLVTTHQEENCESLIEGSSSMVVPSNIPTQEYFSYGNGYNPSDLPPLESLKDYILECRKPLEKQLTNSDVEANLNRLMLNKKHVEKTFLPLLRNDENIEAGIQACAYDIHGNNYTMMFKKWANKYYVLNGEWKDFFQIHKLQKNDYVTVWIFRHSTSNKLSFALVYQKIGR